jgi:hypothetical protein
MTPYSLVSCMFISVAEKSFALKIKKSIYGIGYSSMIAQGNQIQRCHNLGFNCLRIYPCHL